MREKKQRAANAEGESDYIGFRSAELAAKLREIARQNPGQKGLISQIVVNATLEKLERWRVNPLFLAHKAQGWIKQS